MYDRNYGSIMTFKEEISEIYKNSPSRKKLKQHEIIIFEIDHLKTVIRSLASGGYHFIDVPFDPDLEFVYKHFQELGFDVTRCGKIFGADVRIGWKQK